jgi:hypothetical protein
MHQTIPGAAMASSIQAPALKGGIGNINAPALATAIPATLACHRFTARARRSGPTLPTAKAQRHAAAIATTTGIPRGAPVTSLATTATPWTTDTTTASRAARPKLGLIAEILPPAQVVNSGSRTRTTLAASSGRSSGCHYFE